VLAEGRIVERGSHDDLLSADGLYRRLYNLQFRT
jgi:ABC-type multidrug transport system fused ATPase/permease subunit